MSVCINCQFSVVPGQPVQQAKCWKSGELVPLWKPHNCGLYVQSPIFLIRARHKSNPKPI